MEDQTLIQIINAEMNLAILPDTSFEEMRLQLQAIINDLIKNDFQKLVYVLYRIDVNERKLKYLLQENVGEDAAVIITDLIIERQLEKIELRKQYSRPDEEISDEEKW